MRPNNYFNSVETLDWKFKNITMDDGSEVKLKTLYVDHQTWYKAKQVAKLLGYTCTRTITRHVDEADMKRLSELAPALMDLMNTWRTLYINESALQDILMKSKSDRSIKLAKRFQIDMDEIYNGKTRKEYRVIWEPVFDEIYINNVQHWMLSHQHGVVELRGEVDHGWFYWYVETDGDPNYLLKNDNIVSEYEKINGKFIYKIVQDYDDGGTRTYIAEVPIDFEEDSDDEDEIRVLDSHVK